MSSWQEELEQLLSRLGVQQEQPQPEHSSSAHNAEFFFMQTSQTHSGVFYRVDLAGCDPELRVFIPTNDGAFKVRIYLVRLSPQSFLSHFFAMYMTSQGGSPALQEIEGITTYHQFVAIIETMKGLFWKGDLVALQFPPEIDVRCLL